MLNPYYAVAAGVTALSVALYRSATANDRFAAEILEGSRPLEEAEGKLQKLTTALIKFKEQQKLMKEKGMSAFEGNRPEVEGVIMNFGGVEGVRAEIERLQSIIKDLRFTFKTFQLFV